MSYQEIMEMAQQAIVEYVATKYGEAITKNDVNVFFNTSALNITKIMAMDSTPIDRIYVVTLDKNVGTPVVVAYLPD